MCSLPCFRNALFCYALCVQLGQFFRNGFISCFQCFNVNLMCSHVFPIFISTSSASHVIIGSTSSACVCYSLVAVIILPSTGYTSSTRAMIISWSSISFPCLSSSVIIWFLPRMCVLLSFYKILDASIVSRISSMLCFRMSSLAFSFIRRDLWGSCFLNASSLELLQAMQSIGFFVLVCFAMLLAS